MENEIIDSNINETALPAEMVEHLRAANIWKRFYGIVMMCFGILYVFLGIYISNKAYVGGTAFLVTYSIMGALIFIPALMMFQATGYFKNYFNENGTENLSKGFKKERQSWTFVGILLIIGIVLVLLAFLVNGEVMIKSFGGGRI